MDDEKVMLADETCDEICQHMKRCEEELAKFEEELREKGQLKEPKTGAVKLETPAALAAADSCLAQGASSSADLPAVGQPRARGRNVSFGGAGAAAQQQGAETPSGAPSSHKRGRGRKVSQREAERQRQVAEEKAMEAAAAAASARPPPPVGGPGPPEVSLYPDALLPIASREASCAPLCGAVPSAADHIIPERALVAARPSLSQDWILASVLRYNSVTNKYVVLDADAGDDGAFTA